MRQQFTCQRRGGVRGQEALGLHCRINRLARAKVSQASEIPDSKNMTPWEYVERGRPYCMSIDRSEEEYR